MKTSLSLRQTTRRSLKLLNKKDQSVVIFFSLLQIFLASLDLVGVAIIALLSYVSLNGITVGSNSPRLDSILNTFGLGEMALPQLAATLGIAGGGILILKTISSALVSKKLLLFLSSKSTLLSKRVIRETFNSDYSFVNSASRASISFSLTEGVDRLVIGVVGSIVNLAADFFLVSILFISLFFIDPLLAFVTIIFFGLVSVVIYLVQSSTASNLGHQLANSRIVINDSIAALFGTIRERRLRGTNELEVARIGNLKGEQSDSWAKLSFQPNVSKYILEIALILGSLVLGATQFVVHDARHAISQLSIFIAMSMRLVPTLLRLQSNLLTIRANAGVASKTLQILEDSKNLDFVQLPKEREFRKKLSCENLTFRYPSARENALKSVSMDFEVGQINAIVGPSGSGKSTLADCILGFLEPLSGTVNMFGQDAKSFIRDNPGAVSYVPQHINISKGTLRENILLDLPSSKFSDAEIINLLADLELSNFVGQLPHGLDSNLGEFGSVMSGGQKQRIGIARALATSPLVIVFDESTSALDSGTESNIFLNLESRLQAVTRIVIAHRLKTVEMSSKVFYLEQGVLLACGTFNDVRTQVPDFETQAGLQGM